MDHLYATGFDRSVVASNHEDVPVSFAFVDPVRLDATWAEARKHILDFARGESIFGGALGSKSFIEDFMKDDAGLDCWHTASNQIFDVYSHLIVYGESSCVLCSVRCV
jgi:hypothetical protein